jgi:hypothetical protein
MSNAEQIVASGGAMLSISACAGMLRRGAMKLHETDTRLPSSIAPRALSLFAFLFVIFLFCTGRWRPASAQQHGMSCPALNAPLSREQVVDNIVGMNLERAQALHAYQVTETYRLAYRGFPGARNAEMIVDAKYQSPGTKIFTIQSATGSALILDRVFRKLLQAEDEALEVEAQRHTALNRNNYDFALVGCKSMPSGSMYVLHVKPRRKGKFLYRGRIWVDAKDFAVVRVEAEPAKNPSFWTKNSEIERVYEKIGDFWLPARNHSITTVRLGGRAELTIRYTNYAITSADTVGNLPASKPTQTADTTRAQSTKLQANTQAPAE